MQRSNVSGRKIQKLRLPCHSLPSSLVGPLEELEDFMTKADHLRLSEAALLAEQSQLAQDPTCGFQRKIDSG